jgi:hypothetical protein
MAYKMRDLVRFVMCSCGRHGCFLGKDIEREELHTRNEVFARAMLYLIKGYINYNELDRIWKEVNRANLSNTPYECLNI